LGEVTRSVGDVRQTIDASKEKNLGRGGTISMGKAQSNKHANYDTPVFWQMKTGTRG